MVSLKAHGGHCCGAQHIYGFTNQNPAADILELYQLTQQRDPCLHEVILNENQCRNNPALLNKLAQLGYVLTTGFVNGNHNSFVYVFHRAGRRLPLNNLNFDWAGQIVSPSIAGALPRLPEIPGHIHNGTPMITAIRGSYVAPQHIRPGDVFIYHNPQNDLHGAQLVYVGPLAPSQYVTRIYLTTVSTGRVVLRAISSLRWYEQANPPTVDQLPVVPLQRHTQNDNHIPAPVEPPRVVYSTYHNVFRDGRVGPGYPSLEEARNGAPRVTVRHRQDVYSDGTVETTVLP